MVCKQRLVCVDAPKLRNSCFGANFLLSTQRKICLLLANDALLHPCLSVSPSPTHGRPAAPSLPEVWVHL